MFVFDDLTGQRFNRLIALRCIGADRNRVSLWLFKCDCGAELIARGAAVKRGHTRSCGCLRKETAAQQIRKLWRSGKDNWNWRHGKRCRGFPGGAKIEE
jgi:hypothetical protein